MSEDAGIDYGKVEWKKDEKVAEPVKEESKSAVGKLVSWIAEHKKLAIGGAVVLGLLMAFGLSEESEE